ncbi:MAG: uncharacterized protein A8A55_1859 [Amphiamblys sp. WSBS2006]|nr:MAG: uncharacterized protein A8A55_1859 [Amphiamblys sp. WSBS2006]
MENLQEQTAFPWNISFARYKSKYFVEINEGLLIVPSIAYEHQGEVRAIQESLFRLKQEVLVASGRSDADAMCIACEDNNSDGVFLFPVCREAHHFVCLDCLKEEAEKGTERILCPYDREDPFAMTEYRRIVSERHEAFRNRLAAQPAHTPDDFSLTTTIPDKPTLLTEQTTVSLENIAISETLFFVLLSKTKVRVGENLSLFGDSNGEDCIAEHDMARSTPVLLRQKEQSEPNTPLFLENISNIPSNSIGCTLGNFLIDISIRLLTKLRISGGGDYEFLSLVIEKEEHLKEILAMEDKSVFVGKRKTVTLRGYAANILPKLAFHEDIEIEHLDLGMEKEEHVIRILAMEEGSFSVGKTREITLQGYATNMLPQINFHEDNEIEYLVLEARKEEHVIRILAMEDGSFSVGKKGAITLGNYAVNILPKLAFHEDNEIKALFLFADQENHIRPIIARGGNIFLGKMEEIYLRGYAHNILSKLTFHKDNKMLFLNLKKTEKKMYIREILGVEDRSIFVGKVGMMFLSEYAINIFPKLRFHKNTDRLFLSAEREEYIAPTLAREQKFCPGGIDIISLYNYAIFLLVKMDMTGRNHPGRLMLFSAVVYRPGILREYENNISIGDLDQVDIDGYALVLLGKLRTGKEYRGRGCFGSDASKASHITKALGEADKSIVIGEMSTARLKGYSVNILPKLFLGELGELVLVADEEYHVSHILEAGNGSIDIGGVKDLELHDYAVNVLPKLKIGGEKEMKRFVLRKKREGSMTSILSMEDGSIEIGSIKRKWFDVPEEIKPKLKYILVDEKETK